MTKKYYLGIDVGGTVVKMGLVNEGGKVFDKVSFAPADFNSKEKLLTQLIKTAAEILDRNAERKISVAGIGVGVPGLVNFKKGLIYLLTNIFGWKNVKIAEILRKEMGLPVLVDNDVNVITLGEFIFGAGRGTKNMICVTLGTGVGGGLIIGGKLYRGSSYSAGEIGHFPLDGKGPKCNCGSYGCLERYIGNKYFVSQVLQKIKTSGAGNKILKLAGGEFDKITPEIIAKAAKEKDKLAKAAWNALAHNLGMVLAGLVNFLNPDAIVVGGGLAGAGDALFAPLKKTVEKFSLKIPFSAVRIHRAQLKNEAGIIGAAALFMN